MTKTTQKWGNKLTLQTTGPLPTEKSKQRTPTELCAVTAPYKKTSCTCCYSSISQHIRCYPKLMGLSVWLTLLLRSTNLVHAVLILFSFLIPRHKYLQKTFCITVKSKYSSNIPVILLFKSSCKSILNNLEQAPWINNKVLFFRALSALSLKHPIVNNIFPYNCTLKWSLFLSFLQRHLCFSPLNKTGHSFVASLYKQHWMHTPDSRHYQQPAKHGNNLGIITGYPKQ